MTGFRNLLECQLVFERPGLGLAVTDHAGNDQIGVVDGAISVRQGVAELAALVDRAGRLGRHVARDAAGERELGDEALHARLVTETFG